MNRLANLLHAASLAVADAQAQALGDQAALNPSATATLLTLGQHAPQTLSQIAGVVGLSHSATVRLVDGLSDKGLVRRGNGQDRREVAVSLTPEGHALYTGLRAAQDAVLTPLVAIFSPAEQRALEDGLARILAALTTGRQCADHICRFCDEDVCGQEECPVERRALTLAKA